MLSQLIQILLSRFASVVNKFGSQLCRHDNIHYCYSILKLPENDGGALLFNIFLHHRKKLSRFLTGTQSVELLRNMWEQSVHMTCSNSHQRARLETKANTDYKNSVVVRMLFSQIMFQQDINLNRPLK